MQLNECLNLLSIQERRHFCSPFLVRHLFKCHLGDGESQCFIPVLSDRVLVGIFWNHHFIFYGQGRGHTSLSQCASPKTPPDSIGSTVHSSLQWQAHTLPHSFVVGHSSLTD